MSVSSNINALEWDHKDLWRKRGKNFLVEVSRHTEGDGRDEGTNRWCVYAYLYPQHPHFAAFDLASNSLFQDAATCMPLHGYPSLVEYPQYDGKVTSVKVGADYHHLHDTEFTYFDTKEQAGEVFNDAQRLVDWLTLKEQA